MRKIICPSCSFSTTEADKEWDAVTVSGRCPKCAAPLEAQQLAGTQGALKTSSNSYSQSNFHNSVVVTDIQMPFISMVIFMVKWVIASIPAFIILFILFTFISALGIGLLKH